MFALRKNFESGRDPRHSGSAFAVFHRGECVVDVFGGYADAEIKQTWNQNTLSIVYSTTKGIYVERGISPGDCFHMYGEVRILNFNSVMRILNIRSCTHEF